MHPRGGQEPAAEPKPGHRGADAAQERGDPAGFRPDDAIIPRQRRAQPALPGWPLARGAGASVRVRGAGSAT